MHEVSVAESMFEIIEDVLGGRAPLASATMSLGPLTGINPASLRFCFAEVAERMGFGRPELHIVRVPAQAACLACGKRFPMHNPFDLCPACGGLDRDVEGGKVFTLDAVDVLEEPAAAPPARPGHVREGDRGGAA